MFQRFFVSVTFHTKSPTLTGRTFIVNIKNILFYEQNVNIKVIFIFATNYTMLHSSPVN